VSQVNQLVQAVTIHTNSSPIALGNYAGLDVHALQKWAEKVPWKQVAESMEAAGTYKYGNATVKKKYMEVLRQRGAPF
jgi:hypothetical protein